MEKSYLMNSQSKKNHKKTTTKNPPKNNNNKSRPPISRNKIISPKNSGSVQAGITDDIVLNTLRTRNKYIIYSYISTYKHL